MQPQTCIIGVRNIAQSGGTGPVKEKALYQTTPGPWAGRKTIDMKLTNDPFALKVTAGLVLAGLLLFGASFNDPFHFDDTLIANDSNVTNGARWAHFLNPFYLRQLTFFSFYLNHLVGGLNPSGYHVVNVALHIANAVLLYLLLGRFVERWLAIVAAAIFLVHPIQTEPVLYVYQRSILLACFFSLLALIALVERRHWLAVVFFMCAFEGKESAIAVPLALVVLHELTKVWNTKSPPALVKSRSGDSVTPSLGHHYTIALFAGAAVLGVIAVGLLAYWEEQTVGIGAADQISPFRYFLAETRVIYTYLRLLFFPHPQSLEYEFPESPGILPPLGILVILGTGWWLSMHERSRLAGLCMLAFFILLAPTSSVVPSKDAAFEHRLYLPMLAFSVWAAYALSRIPRRSWVGIGLFCVLSVMTIRRGTVWSSDIALWEDTAKHAPLKARVWFNLGGAYLNSDPEKARAALLRALELQPDFTEALYDLGVIEQGRGNWSSALAYYERVVQIQSGYWPAWNNMGNTLFTMGERERALEYFEKTLRLNRDYWPAQYNIAIVHFMNGRYSEALPRLKTVLDWRPDFREARYLLALSLTRAGYRASADEEWKKLGEVTAAESRITPTMILAPNRP